MVTNLRKSICSLFMMIGISIAIAGNCYAGDINSEEARVYSAACGTFTYEGVTYTAHSSYLSQMSAYLMRDDIDLDRSQANSAIRSMSRKVNIKQAIDNGYLVSATSSTPETPEDTESPQTPENPDTPSTESTESPQTPSTPADPGTTTDPNVPATEVETETGTEGDKPDDTEKEDTESDDTEKTDRGKNPNKDNTESDSEKDGSTGTTPTGGGTGTGSGTDGTGTSDTTTAGGTASQNTDSYDTSAQAEEAAYANQQNQEQREEILQTRPAKEEADAGIITYDEETNEIIFSGSRNQQITLPGAFNQIKGTRTRNIVLFVELLLLLIAASCIGAMFVCRCFSFQKKRTKTHYGNHKTRRKMRKISGPVLIVVMAVNVFVCLGCLGVWVGLFQTDRVTDTLSASGYYHESFNDMIDEIHTLLETAGCPKNACDNVVTYDNYLFATRNHVRLALKGETASAEYADMSTKVAEAIDGVAYLTDDSRQEIGDAVLSLYQQYVGNIIGESMHGFKQIFTNIFEINILISLVTILLCIVSMLYMDHYKHRGMRKIAFAVLLAVLGIVCVCLFMLIAKPYSKLYIEPDYLYLFVANYISFVNKVLACLSAAGAVVAVLVYIGGKMMKRQISES